VSLFYDLEFYLNPQASGFCGHCCYFATMRQDNVMGYCKAQTGTAAITTPRMFHPIEAFEQMW
jgi:hypothetical protein